MILKEWQDTDYFILIKEWLDRNKEVTYFAKINWGCLADNLVIYLKYERRMVEMGWARCLIEGGMQYGLRMYAFPASLFICLPASPNLIGRLSRIVQKWAHCFRMMWSHTLSWFAPAALVCLHLVFDLSKYKQKDC